jgi:hypothetical protein
MFVNVCLCVCVWLGVEKTYERVPFRKTLHVIGILRMSEFDILSTKHDIYRVFT